MEGPGARRVVQALTVVLQAARVRLGLASPDSTAPVGTEPAPLAPRNALVLATILEDLLDGVATSAAATPDLPLARLTLLESTVSDVAIAPSVAVIVGNGSEETRGARGVGQALTSRAACCPGRVGAPRRTCQMPRRVSLTTSFSGAWCLA